MVLQEFCWCIITSIYVSSIVIIDIRREYQHQSILYQKRKYGIIIYKLSDCTGISLEKPGSVAYSMVVIRKDAILRARFSAFLQDPDLFRNIAKSSNDFLVAINKRENGIRNAGVTTELKDKLLGATEVVTRDTRVEVMDGLELKTAMEEIQPCRAVHIHCGTQHLLGKRLLDTQIGSGHGKVGEGNLHMQWGCHHVGDENEKHPISCIRNRPVDNAVAKPYPEENLASDLKPAMPPGRAPFGSLVAKEVLEAQHIQVESTEH